MKHVDDDPVHHKKEEKKITTHPCRTSHAPRIPLPPPPRLLDNFWRNPTNVVRVHLVQPIAVQRPAGLQWSVELRRQATATYRERSRAESEVEAGSARCSPLPPKVRMLMLYIEV